MPSTAGSDLVAGRHRIGSLSAVTPRTIDHVALWVADRDSIADQLLDGLGYHVIERTDRFTLLGADARRFKLTLFDAEGPREQGALKHVTLRSRDGEEQRLEAGEGLTVEVVRAEPRSTTTSTTSRSTPATRSPPPAPTSSSASTRRNRATGGRGSSSAAPSSSSTRATSRRANGRCSTTSPSSSTTRTTRRSCRPRSPTSSTGRTRTPCSCGARSASRSSTSSTSRRSR